MLRLIPKLIAGLLALSLLAIGAIAVALPRLINSDEFRASLHESAAEALGTPVEWASLDAGVVPLRLTMIDPVLVAEGGHRDDARLLAESIELRLSAAELLRQKVQVDSLVLKGVELVVTRTAEGWQLPFGNAGGEAPGSQPGSSDSPDAVPPTAPEQAPNDPGDAPQEGDTALSLALHRFVLEDSRLVIHDRLLPRPIEWVFDDLNLEAEGADLDAPLTLVASARVLSNKRDIGGLELLGDASFAGFYDLDLLLDALRIEELQPYVSDATLAGAATGRLSLEGDAAGVTKTEADLRLAEMAIKTLGLNLVGELDLKATQGATGPLAFDASLDLGVGGEAQLDGTMALDGGFDAAIQLERLDLEPYAALAGGGLSVGGHATGRLDVVATAAGGLEKLSTDLRIPDARYADAALELAGALDLGLKLDGLGESDPVRFDVAMVLIEEGGRIEGAGEATLAGAVDAKLVFGNVDLAKVAPWVPEGVQLDGRLTGDADLRMTADRVIERLKTQIAIASARLMSGPIDVAGKFDLDLDLNPSRGSGGGEPIRLNSALILDDGSGLEVVGTSTVEGEADLVATLERFDLALIRPFLPDPEMELAGLASGTGRLVGDVTTPEFLSLDLGIENGKFKTSEYEAEGPFLAVVKVKEPLTRPRGRVELDLTAARLRYLDQFNKKAGMRAQLTTRFIPEESGEVVFESKLELRNIDEILIQGAMGESTSITVSMTDFNLEGWSEVFPALAVYDADGVISIDGLGVEWAEGAPQRFGGRIFFRGVGLTLPEAGRVRLRGTILGEETRIRTKGLKARLEGATIGIKGAIEDPLGAGEFDLAVETLGETEVNDVLSSLTSAPDRIFGPLEFAGRVTGRLDSPKGLTETLDGAIRFAVGKRESGGEGGRLRGVSILRTILDQIPLVGGAARLTQPFRGGRSVDDYFTEEFDVIEGDFEIGEGKVVAETLRLAYPGYEARLHGPMQLRDLSIDMTGELILKGDLVSTIGGLAGADMPDRKPIRIQLARVTNTLNEPKVVMTKETLAVVPKLLLQGTGIDTLTLGIGKGIGKGVGKAIDAVLGSGN